MDSDWNFGCDYSRQLTLRPVTPWAFVTWDGKRFRFAPWRLLNPLRWFNAAKYRANWRFEWRYDPNANHRCWCPVGTMIDGALVVCGFGFVWFYSHFTGETPCPCDKVLAELDELEWE